MPEKQRAFHVFSNQGDLLDMTRTAVVLMALLALAGCGGQDTKDVTETRTTAPPAATTPAMPPGHDMQMPPMGGGMMPPGHPSISPYKWQVPEGWSEAPATSMRVGNFKIAADPQAECYLTVLKGAAGGVDANINRWRRQMGQPELTPEEIAALPKLEVFGKPAPMVEIPGSFTGMAGEQFPDYLLMGVVVLLTDETLFVKMTGPKAVIETERERFAAFCKSLADAEATGTAVAPPLAPAAAAPAPVAEPAPAAAPAPAAVEPAADAAATETKPLNGGEATSDAGAKENK
jgi:hypothetical protein